MVLLRFNKETEVWDTVSEEDKLETDLYLDGLLKKKLDFAKKQQANNNDVVGIISGDEGSGKSSLAGNIMRYITDDKFDPKKDMIGSDMEDAINKLLNAEEKSALMFDEGNVFFLSTETMKREQRNLHKVFSIFRQKNLFVLIVLPSFFRLGSYFAQDRSRFLIRTYLNNMGERSYFAYYGNMRKDNLYRFGKKDKNYNVTQPNFRGRFSSCYPLETKEYKAFKLRTLQKSFEEALPKKTKTAEQVRKEHDYKEIKRLYDSGFKTIEIAKIKDISQRRVQQILQKDKPQEDKVVCT